MEIRIRFLGNDADLEEYGLSIKNPEYPLAFLQISPSAVDYEKIRKWAVASSLPVYSSENYLWINLPVEYLAATLDKMRVHFPNVPSLKLSEQGQKIIAGPKNIVLGNEPVIMGIINATPDSFSDGGLYNEAETAKEQALQLIKDGTQIIDVGGESTRPGADKVTEEEEWNRIEPVLSGLVSSLPKNILLSVDTYKAEVAKKALHTGADMVNDISGMTFDAQMAEVVAEFDVPVCVMHIKGSPENMQKNPSYNHVTDEILAYFEERIKFAEAKGITKLILDPGIGFGKRPEDNFEILRRFKEFKQFGYPVLLGLSRKSFIWRTLDITPAETEEMTVLMNALGVLNGADIIRVHNARLHGFMKKMLYLYLHGKAN